MPLVLCYHAVSDEWDHPLAVRLSELERHVTAAQKLGAVHVTFDDAYRSVRRAMPLLETLGVPATVFVCTDYAAEGRKLELPPLDRLPARQREELATLTWDDLRGLAERGVKIGSHTRTHPDLRTLDEAELQREVAASREEIESELGRPCRFFAYPYGQHDERSQRAVERAGYQAAFGLVGVGRVGGRFAVGRVEPARDDGRVALLVKSSRAWPLLAPQLRRLRSVLTR